MRAFCQGERSQKTAIFALYFYKVACLLYVVTTFKFTCVVMLLVILLVFIFHMLGCTKTKDSAVLVRMFGKTNND